ncbi:multiple cyclophane-containing RiPP AmcA [Streptomyces sp. JNUCC 64]
MTTLERLVSSNAPIVVELSSTSDVLSHTTAGTPWDNRPTWDNWAKTPAPFDNRPTWDNWSKK